MIRYNWQAIKKYTKMDLKKIITYLEIVHNQRIDVVDYLRNNEYARNIVKESQGESGMSYMANFEAFRDNLSKATDQEMLVYLDLISKRDYFTFLNTKRKVNYLPIWKMVDTYNIEKLKTNRLLLINKHNIYFVHEGDY